jgi:hypothetical protein
MKKKASVTIQDETVYLDFFVYLNTVKDNFESLYGIEKDNGPLKTIDSAVYHILTFQDFLLANNRYQHMGGYQDVAAQAVLDIMRSHGIYDEEFNLNHQKYIVKDGKVERYVEEQLGFGAK